MTVLIACETLLLLLLSVLVAGLLRSHAELLRRIGPLPDAAGPPGGADPSLARAGGRIASDIAGLTPAGDAMKLSLGGGQASLLAFLSSGCAGCETFWRELALPERRAQLPAGARVILITHDSSRESPAAIAARAPEGVTVLMSREAWSDYGVALTPYMVFVDAAGKVIGEGTAGGFGQLLGLLSDALADRNGAWRGTPAGDSPDQTLAAAGISAGHPSLYPNANGGRKDGEPAEGRPAA